MQPLQANLSKPNRCALDDAGVEVERRTNANQNRIQPITVREHPGLLLRAPKPNPNDSRAGVSNHFYYCDIFLRQKFAKWRRKRTDNSDPRKLSREITFKAPEGFRSAAI